MKRLLSSRSQWRTFVVLAAGAFVYFSGAFAMLEYSLNGSPTMSALTMAVRAGAACVVALALLANERQRIERAVPVAVKDGLVFAAIIIAADLFLGPEGSGTEFLLRTVVILIGFPSLAVAAHLALRT